MTTRLNSYMTQAWTFTFVDLEHLELADFGSSDRDVRQPTQVLSAAGAVVRWLSKIAGVRNALNAGNLLFPRLRRRRNPARISLVPIAVPGRAPFFDLAFSFSQYRIG